MLARACAHAARAPLFVVEKTGTFRRLAHARKRTIAVFSAVAPLLVTGEEYADNGPRLELCYHKHYYGLGEHYNAVVLS